MREATRTDVPELSALAKRTWSDAFGHAFTPEDQTADAAARRSEPFFSRALTTCTVLVAVQDQMVGYAKFGPCDIPEAAATARDRELHRLYVDTKLHGRGIGRTLLHAALDHPVLSSAERVFLNVWEENVPALRLYESCGFRRAGISRYTVGATELEDLVMVRAQPTGHVPSR